MKYGDKRVRQQLFHKCYSCHRPPIGRELSHQSSVCRSHCKNRNVCTNGFWVSPSVTPLGAGRLQGGSVPPAVRNRSIRTINPVQSSPLGSGYPPLSASQVWLGDAGRICPASVSIEILVKSFTKYVGNGTLLP